MRLGFALAFSVFALVSLALAASFPPDAIVILIGTQVSQGTEGAAIPTPTPSSQPQQTQLQGVSAQLQNALSKTCSPNIAEKILKYSAEAVSAARSRGNPAPTFEELAVMAAAMVMSEHQAIRGESLGVCRDSSSRLSATNDCGAFQINLHGSSIYPGKTRNQVYNTNTNPNSPDYTLSCFNPDNNVREGVYEVLGAWQAYRRNFGDYPSRSGGPPEIGYVGLIYNKGGAGAKRPSDPNNYYARFIANYNHVKSLVK